MRRLKNRQNSFRKKAEFLTRTFLTVMVYFVKEKVGY